MQKPLAFISYSSADKNIADNLCSKLEQNGVCVWYAPRNIDTADYASAIVKAITNCTHFIVIISHNSLQSQHVLNEIDLAFQELRRKIRFYPLNWIQRKWDPRSDTICRVSIGWTPVVRRLKHGWINLSGR